MRGLQFKNQRICWCRLNEGIQCWWRHRIMWHRIFPKICATCIKILWNYCGGFMNVLVEVKRWAYFTFCSSHIMLFRFLHIPCTVRQPAKSTFTWPLICSPQKYMWSGSSKMTSNWRISSGTCRLQNSCNTRHKAVYVIRYLNVLGLYYSSVRNRYAEFLPCTYVQFSF
jgi:hypothetical protein